jgi:hypothetical protein
MDFMDKDDIIKLLKSKASKRNVEGMARFGINTKNALGISVYVLRILILGIYAIRYAQIYLIKQTWPGIKRLNGPREKKSL